MKDRVIHTCLSLMHKNYHYDDIKKKVQNDKIGKNLNP